MKISFAKPGLPKGGALVIGIPDGNKLSGAAAEVDGETGGLLGRALKKGKFKGKLGQTLLLGAPGGFPLDTILLLGLGKPGDWSQTDPEKLGGNIVKALAEASESTATLLLEGVEKAKAGPGEIAARVGFGALLGSYRFDRYRTKEAEDKKPALTRLVVATEGASEAEKAFETYAEIAEGVFLTRDLVTEPANVLYPKEFAKRCKELRSLGVKVEVLGEKEMTELGMGSLLGVGQGSAQESQLVVLEWDGLSKDSDVKPVAFVGKGVTFDTGGISLKPPAGMEEMKFDMGGAGTITGAFRALAARKAKARVVGILGLVENMPSHKAQRPGDVVRSASGQTIEVINTDAEGRLVLADALWYVQDRFEPQCIIDLATLTGAIIVSLGHEYAGLFSNNDKLVKQVTAAGENEGEPVWRMPLGDAYDKLLESDIADMKNIGGKWAGSITAAQFLQRFIKDGTPWAHLDIAGTAWKYKASETVPKGAAGWGVRLLNRFVADHFEAKG